ncbi:hypothetical protein SGI36_21330, partial [Providencia rettgeri]
CAKWAVTEHNKITHDYLAYDSTVEGWYHEVNPFVIIFKLHIKAKECIGRVRDYIAVVKEEKPLTEKIKKLEDFYLIRPKK